MILNSYVSYIGIPSLAFLHSSRSRLYSLINSEKAEVDSVPVDVTKVVRYELPPAKAAVKLVSADNVAESVELLHNEAKVI